MLNEFLFTKIEEEDIGSIWFQQDGATCHTAEAKLNVLRPVFEDRIISRRADVVWPPRSCDLTPLEYYLWGTVRDKCYADKLLVKYSCTQSIMCLKIEPILSADAEAFFKKAFFKKKRYMAQGPPTIKNGKLHTKDTY